MASILTSKQEWKRLRVLLSDTSVELLHHLLTTNTPTIHVLFVYSNSTSSSYSIANIALMCKTTKLVVYSVTPEYMILKNQLIILTVAITDVTEKDCIALAAFLHENNVLRELYT